MILEERSHDPHSGGPPGVEVGRSRAMLPARIALAAAGAALLWRTLPLGSEDPFRATLALLPLVALGLSEVARWVERRGAAARAAPAELALLALGVLACLGRDHLGLRYQAGVADPLVAALLLGALAVRVWLLVAALRAAIGERLPPRPPWVFFALPLVVYLAILPWSNARRPPDGDEPWYLLVTHSLAYDFDARLSNNYERGDSLAFVPRRLGPQAGDPKGPDGEFYSRHNVVLPLLLAPAYRVAGVLGALTVMASLSAALTWMILHVAAGLRRYGTGALLSVWALVAFAPPLLLYSYQVWVEVPAALLVTIFLDRLEQLRRGAGNSRVHWSILLVVLVALPLLKFRFAPIAAMLLVVALPRVDAATRRRLLKVGGLLGVGAIGLVASNLAFFGQPFKYYDTRVFQIMLRPPADSLSGIAGALFDPAFGLIGTAPIWLLLAPAALYAFRRGDRPLFWNLAIVAPYGWLLGSLLQWYGAWSPPFRYGFVALPILALTLLPLFDDRRRRASGLLIGALATVTAVLTLVWLLLPGWTYNIADGRGFLVDRLTGLLDADFARWIPSYVRANRAALLWPPIAVGAALALWRWPSKRPRGAGSWGAAAALVGAAVLTLAVSSSTTRVVEFEDPLVVPDGGQLYPERWAPNRPIHRGGWLIEPGDSLSVPIRAGGTTLDLELDLQNRAWGAPPTVVAIRAGPDTLWRFELTENGWTTVRASELPWPEGQPLGIALESGPTRAKVLLDRARLRWSPASP